MTARAAGRWARCAAALAAAALAAGCSTERLLPTPPRTATQQLLASSAVDRALEQLVWPEFDGRGVTIDVSSTEDGDYVRGAATEAVLRRGGRVVAREQADVVLHVVAGAVGVERRETFLGIPRTQTLFGTIPEIPLYGDTHRRGIAEVQISMRDAKTGTLLAASGPVFGQTYIDSSDVLFVGKRTTDIATPPTE